MKTCKKCGETKALTEFYVDPYRPCKLCRNLEAKERYATNRNYYTSYRKTNEEAIIRRRKIYYEANKEKTIRDVKQWGAENPDKVKAAQKRFHERHPKYEQVKALKDRKELKKHYVKSLVSREIPIENVPQALIEAKRLQLMIWRMAHENSNNTTK